MRDADGSARKGRDDDVDDVVRGAIDDRGVDADGGSSER